MYASVDDVITKLWLWAISANERLRIERFLSRTAPEITAIIWDVKKSTKTTNIYRCDVSRDFTTFYLPKIEVESIQKIEWKSYTWVLGTDYKILSPQNRKIVMSDLYKYISHWDDLWYFNVEYISWFDKMPQDIIFAHILLVEEEMNKSGWQVVASYKMWPRSIVYAKAQDVKSSKESFASYLNKYKTLSI